MLFLTLTLYLYKTIKLMNAFQQLILVKNGEKEEYLLNPKLPNQEATKMINKIIEAHNPDDWFIN